MHCSIRREASSVCLRDLGSTNGTRVNGGTGARTRRRAASHRRPGRGGRSDLQAARLREPGVAVSRAGAPHDGASTASPRCATAARSRRCSRPRSRAAAATSIALCLLLDRRGPLQGDQRPARPPGRRPRAATHRGAAGAAGAARGLRGALRRRRVRDRDARDGLAAARLVFGERLRGAVELRAGSSFGEADGARSPSRSAWRSGSRQHDAARGPDRGRRRRRCYEAKHAGRNRVAGCRSVHALARDQGGGLDAEAAHRLLPEPLVALLEQEARARPAPPATSPRRSRARAARRPSPRSRGRRARAAPASRPRAAARPASASSGCRARSSPPRAPRGRVVHHHPALVLADRAAPVDAARSRLPRQAKSRFWQSALIGKSVRRFTTSPSAPCSTSCSSISTTLRRKFGIEHEVHRDEQRRGEIRGHGGG